MRVRAGALIGVLLLAGCAGEARPPVVDASEVEASESASPTADPAEARLAELRETDQFDEFAEHERAAKADGARLAWENFAPIVDGERVEWANKAELWDSIAPKIRDEALLLGPEYRKPLWNETRSIPNAVSMAWSDKTTGGRGQYLEFSAIYEGAAGPAERFWAFLVVMDSTGRGRVVGAMTPFDLAEVDYPSSMAADDELQRRTWAWVQQQEGQA